MRYLITAGGTREYIDPVRYISNASSGKTGYAIAAAAAERGHDVTLISTVRGRGLDGVKVIYADSAAEMFEAVSENFDSCDVLVMAAAVADYAPAGTSSTKIKKQSGELMIRLIPTVDILRWAAEHRQNQVLVGFALEDVELRARSEEKMAKKNLDMIVANSPQVIGSDSTSVEILVRGGSWVGVDRADKAVVAERIVEQIERIVRV